MDKSTPHGVSVCGIEMGEVYEPTPHEISDPRIIDHVMRTPKHWRSLGTLKTRQPKHHVR